MAIVPLFGVGYQSSSPNVSAQRLTNLFYRPSTDADKTKLGLFGTPGLTLFAATDSVTNAAGLSSTTWPSRGMIGFGGYIYTVHKNLVIQLSSTGAYVATAGSIGTSTGAVSMAWNGLQCVLVDGTLGYYFTAGGAVTQISDVDFPANPTSVCVANQRFVVSIANSGRFQWSDLLSATSWVGTDFATAETDPDNLVSVWFDHGILHLLGNLTSEFWSGADYPTTFARNAAAEWGCAASASVAKFDTGLIMLGKNRLGEYQVIKFSGYQAVPVSDSDVSYAINALSNLSQAVGFSYLMDGIQFYELNVGGYTFLYNGTVGNWSMLTTGASGGRHLANRRAALVDSPIVADYQNGNLYTLDKNNYTDNTAVVVREAITRHSSANLDRFTVSELQVDLEGGIGLNSGQGSDPQIMLQVSKDNGHTWGNEMFASAGMLGKYLTRVIWRRLGLARDFLFKIRVSDPIKVAIVQAAMRIK